MKNNEPTWNEGKDFPKPDPLNPKTYSCPKCGMEMRQIMYYVCPQKDCPCFSKVSY